eukprot:CAMPEP_0113293276 /NCGR_PEP_ID=MMETSP0008_2-20120614/35243_1 /TAXON_ID=97485 /ORGANISM="Prymnesium parvum" /LENGTH=98 /DNA_ID=CAMNT_0000145739 /DNA_START=1747 /DNA_END=2040 /DNA_ORIENTATION=- /assembly_acc=CAM_ASM_000153
MPPGGKGPDSLPNQFIPLMWKGSPLAYNLPSNLVPNSSGSPASGSGGDDPSVSAAASPETEFASFRRRELMCFGALDEALAATVVSRISSHACIAQVP